MKKKIYIIHILFLWIGFLTPIFSQYEISLNYNIGFLQKNQFVNSMYNTFFRYYQINQPYLIYRDKISNHYDWEFAFFIHQLFYLNDFFKIGIENNKFPAIYSTYISEDGQYKIKWYGQYNNIFLDYGKNFLIKRNNFLEVFGGIGIIWEGRFYFKEYETNQSPFRESFDYSTGKFISSEGMLFRLGFNYLYRLKYSNLRVGIVYQYAILRSWDNTEENKKIFLFNKNWIWITNDISQYIKDKEQYELENRQILQTFPLLESVKPVFSFFKFFIGIGIKF